MASDLDEYFVEEKTGLDRLLDFLVFVAVFVVTIFLILEIFAEPAGFDLERINTLYLYVNVGVFLIFFADLVRLWTQAQGPKDFFKKNWLDILATIPFGLIAQGVSAFAVLKVARLTKLAKVQKISRISKIGKEFKAASHLKKEGEEYKKKHRL